MSKDWHLGSAHILTEGIYYGLGICHSVIRALSSECCQRLTYPDRSLQAQSVGFMGGRCQPSESGPWQDALLPNLMAKT